MSTAQPPSTSDFSKPDRICDLVMKGGITSGVVYPRAAVDLARRFRFRNIGGTSAGAIAAAATAAAEFGRAKGGFERLAELPEFLVGTPPGGGSSNLFAFFQPQRGTRKLFQIGIAALGGGPMAAWRVVMATLRAFPVEAFLGALPGLILLYGTVTRADGIFFVTSLLASLLLLAIGILLASCLAILANAGSRLPANFFGLCTGMSDPPSNAPASSAKPGGGQPLTEWLTQYLDWLAGIDRPEQPLTFGDLWGKNENAQDRVINLEMMTTCLTHGRPYRLPFRDDPTTVRENVFYFSPAEFRRLFPERVVRWMEQNPRPIKDAGRRERFKAQGLLPLPEPENLPVVVAVRMSLSFPVLLSAVPLHGVFYSRRKGEEPASDAPETPERCWFSDGGICSNFPLHFFDSPLPRWPTLSINLIDKPEGTQPKVLIQPEMAQSNGDRIQEHWNRFTQSEAAREDQSVHRTDKPGLAQILGFLMSIPKTMQNWSDNTQSRLPGYRDRIAHVGLTPSEGGLNLNMPVERIKDLGERGAAVAAAFIERFASDPADPNSVTMNWENHRWIRMRSFLASLETMLEKLDRACADHQSKDASYPGWLSKTETRYGTSYPWKDDQQRKLAQEAMEKLRAISAQWQKANHKASDGAPRPFPELRTRPQI